MRWRFGQNRNPASVKDKPPLGKELNGLGIDAVFLFLNAPFQNLHIVGFMDGNDRLENDGARVHAGIDKVDGTAAETDAVLQCLPLGGFSGKGRQKGWMDVHDALGKGIDQHR